MFEDISDSALHTTTLQLAKKERELLYDILLHLKEIDRRRLYLERGHSSLWAYCVNELGYEEASAQRRISAMRAMRELPALEKKIESGALSLSNVAKAQSLIKKCNFENQIEKKLELFAQLENKTMKEAEVILAQHFPEEIKNPETVRAVNGDHFEMKILVSKALKEKLERVRSLLSHLDKNPTWAALLEMMADKIIAQKDPAREVKKSTPKNPSSQRSTKPTRPKNVPAEIKRAVWQRAQGRCEYTFQQTRCSSRQRLQIEHLQPRAFGGTHEIENLKLYCQNHNLYAARIATLV